MSDTKQLAEQMQRIAYLIPRQDVREVMLKGVEEIRRLEALVNSPETENFLEGVKLEAVHQQERWGAEHDEGKSAVDWVFLIGHLLTKASLAFLSGDTEKAKHHIITSAAACRNWHAQVSGEENAMRPGINTYEREGGAAYRAGRLMDTNPYAKKGPTVAADSWANGYRKASMYDTKANG